MFFSKLFAFALALSATLTINGAILPRADGTQSVTTTIHSSSPTSTSPTATVSPTTTSVTSPASTITQTVTSTTSSVTPLPRAPVSCDGIQNWQPNLAYSAGDKVIFNGQLFTASQWSYNSSPGSSDVWIADGQCTQPINNKANCAGVATWQQSQAYTTGSKVVFNGHLWTAVQWTSSNTPGDTSGTWKDLGACA